MALNNPLPPAPPLVLIIEPASVDGLELAEWLSDQRERPEVMLSSSVGAAEKCLRTEKFDWLFVRIRCWDDVQRLALSLPRRVVFLSGRREKGTRHLDRTLDAQLRAPYIPEHLAGVWDRLSSPGHQPQPLDFFFLRVDGQLVTVRYRDIRQVHREGDHLRVETRQGDYLITSNLINFQARLPVPLTAVRPGWLVNEAYQETVPTSETTQ